MHKTLLHLTYYILISLYFPAHEFSVHAKSQTIFIFSLLQFIMVIRQIYGKWKIKRFNTNGYDKIIYCTCNYKKHLNVFWQFSKLLSGPCVFSVMVLNRKGPVCSPGHATNFGTKRTMKPESLKLIHCCQVSLTLWFRSLNPLFQVLRSHQRWRSAAASASALDVPDEGLDQLDEGLLALRRALGSWWGGFGLWWGKQSTRWGGRGTSAEKPE